MDADLVLTEICKAFEGCLQPVKRRPNLFTTYRDPVGVLTLGYGHTNLGASKMRITQGMVWTHDQCVTALSGDVQTSLTEVSTGIKQPLKPWELAALADMHFNTGDVFKSSIPKLLEKGDLEGVAACIKLYDHAGGKVLPGLVRRRACEAALFMGNFVTASKLADEHLDTDDVMAKADQVEALGLPHPAIAAFKAAHLVEPIPQTTVIATGRGGGSTLSPLSSLPPGENPANA